MAVHNQYILREFPSYLPRYIRYEQLSKDEHQNRIGLIKIYESQYVFSVENVRKMGSRNGAMVHKDCTLRHESGCTPFNKSRLALIYISHLYTVINVLNEPCVCRRLAKPGMSRVGRLCTEIADEKVCESESVNVIVCGVNDLIG